MRDSNALTSVAKLFTAVVKVSSAPANSLILSMALLIASISACKSVDSALRVSKEPVEIKADPCEAAFTVEYRESERRKARTVKGPNKPKAGVDW